MELNGDLLIMLAAMLAAGALAGLTAGLFGIGGGIVMVPALYFAFGVLGYGDGPRMHVAVGTSLAVIIVTSIRSVMAHARRGAVDFAIIKAWAPWIVLGALLGAAIAGFIPGRGLTGFFGAMMILLSLQFFFGRPDWKLADEMPRGAARAGLGGLIGVLSALMGIGGGVIGVTLMTLTGRPIHRAVATAAGFGVAIGLPGAIGFVISGWSVADRPPLSLGYVNLAGFAALAACAVLVAPLGARLAHALPAAQLRRAFAVGLSVMGVMLVREALIGA
ncbi:MAG: sulfite exporter TauE/SafE family protein [Maricaulaceae bacterium]|nr:sulfite exporter TauE/SafE family protein [Maricaulaceae bacterium]